MSSNTVKNNEIYGNWAVHHPDGHIMFRCDEKKANWYLSRNLAKLISENTVQLTFVPKGKGHINEPYYLEQKENRCVVCGGTDKLTRHHAVPYCFRRFFPVNLKSQCSHDIVPLCVECHRRYEPLAWELKKTVASKYNVEVNGPSGSGCKLPVDKEGKIAKSAASALCQYGDQITEPRKSKLWEAVENYFHIDRNQITEKDLAVYVQKRQKINIKGEYRFGKDVVDRLEDIDSFIRMWRIHFLDTMQPKFMHKHWDVNHRLKND